MFPSTNIISLNDFQCNNGCALDGDEWGSLRLIEFLVYCLEINKTKENTKNITVKNNAPLAISKGIFYHIKYQIKPRARH